MTLIICIFLIILKVKFPDIYINLEDENYSDSLEKIIKNIDSHYVLDDVNANYYLDLLEFLFLEIFGRLLYPKPKLEKIIEKYANRFNLNESKKTRLLFFEYKYGDPCINLQIVFDIKKTIEISSSFEIN